jgi:hypothetical protein
VGARLGATARHRGARPSSGRSRDEVTGALAALALSGVVGYDLADGGFFRRELPFDLGRVERLQPRLRDARRLVDGSAVRIDAADASGSSAWVAGAGGVEYRVRSTRGRLDVHVSMVGRHRGDRDRASTCWRCSSSRPMTRADALRAAAEAEDEAAIRQLLADLSEADRSDLIPAREVAAVQ